MMMHLHLRSLIISLMVMTLFMPVAADLVTLISSPGCTKCTAAEKVLEEVLVDRPGVDLVIYDVYSDVAREVIRDHQIKGGVPAMVIGERVIGYKDYDGDEVLLEEMIGEALESGGLKGKDQGDADEVGREVSDPSAFSLMTVFLAGLLAGFNPCLLGILAFLATAVISNTGRRHDLILMVTIFSLGIFAMYYLFGMGMLHTLHAETMAARFRQGLVVLLLALGLVHLEGARRLKNGSRSLFKASWSQKYIESALSRGRLTSYFLLGALFSLVKAPCVGAIYIAILGVISDQGYSAGAIYLLLYNLGVIFPVLLLGGVIALGMSPSKVDRFRKDHRAGIRLATGLTLIALAPLIYWQVL